MNYYLFAGNDYHPSGGARDHRGTGTLEWMQQVFVAGIDSWKRSAYCDNPWGHIADADLKVVCFAVRHEGKWVWNFL